MEKFKINGNSRNVEISLNYLKNLLKENGLNSEKIEFSEESINFDNLRLVPEIYVEEFAQEKLSIYDLNDKSITEKYVINSKIDEFICESIVLFISKNYKSDANM